MVASTAPTWRRSWSLSHEHRQNSGTKSDALATLRLKKCRLLRLERGLFGVGRVCGGSGDVMQVERESGGRFKAVVVGSYERDQRAVTVSTLAVTVSIRVGGVLRRPHPGSAAD